MERRTYLSLLGSIAAGTTGIQTTDTASGQDCSLDEIPLVGEAAAAQYNWDEYDESVEKTYRFFSTAHSIFEEHLDTAQSQYSCYMDPAPHTIVAEDPGGTNSLAAVEETLRDNPWYTALGLEYLAADDPNVEAFNSGEITPVKMTDAYLTPRYENGEPVRGIRNPETLRTVFEHCREHEVTLTGLEPAKYPPLYENADYTAEYVENNGYELQQERFDGFVDNITEQVADEDASLVFTSYDIVDNAMHTPIGLLATPLSNRFSILEPADILEQPWDYQPVPPLTQREPDQYTVAEQELDEPVETQLSTSPEAYYAFYNAVTYFLPEEIAETQPIQDISEQITQTLIDISGETPTYADTSLNFDEITMQPLQSSDRINPTSTAEAELIQHPSKPFSLLEPDGSRQ